MANNTQPAESQKKIDSTPVAFGLLEKKVTVNKGNLSVTGTVPQIMSSLEFSTFNQMKETHDSKDSNEIVDEVIDPIKYDENEHPYLFPNENLQNVMKTKKDQSKV